MGNSNNHYKKRNPDLMILGKSVNSLDIKYGDFTCQIFDDEGKSRIWISDTFYIKINADNAAARIAEHAKKDNRSFIVSFEMTFQKKKFRITDKFLVYKDKIIQMSVEICCSNGRHVIKGPLFSIYASITPSPYDLPKWLLIDLFLMAI